MGAAQHLGVDVVVAAEEANTLQGLQPERLLTLDFRAPRDAAETVRTFHEGHPLDAVIAVDDEGTVAAAAIAEALGFKHNTVASAEAARNKLKMRETLQAGGIPVPLFRACRLDEDPARAAGEIVYPCVLKPLSLSASRGVIRADDPTEFAAAFHRIAAILRDPDVRASCDEMADLILVESFLVGQEVSLEGLLRVGELTTLALFDKPDPLDGPFFEETMYVTPSRLPPHVQESVHDLVQRAARTLGLREGPVHAEVRVCKEQPWLVEVAARSIGGLCSRTLRFGTGLSLEDLILRHALGLEIPSLERERMPAGVMMLPIPEAGILQSVRGLDAARAVPFITEVKITAHLGQELVPLPEGSRYLGFLFARAASASAVEAALREAHERLEFVVAPTENGRRAPQGS